MFCIFCSVFEVMDIIRNVILHKLIVFVCFKIFISKCLYRKEHSMAQAPAEARVIKLKQSETLVTVLLLIPLSFPALIKWYSW